VRAVIRYVPISFLVCALGCGSGSGSGGGSFNGVVRGQPMKPADAISSPARVSLGPISADVGAVVLTDVPGVCGRVTANTEPKNGKALVLFVADFNRQTLTATAPAGPGTFDVVNPNSPGIPPLHAAVVTFGVNDATCGQIADQSAVATSGAVKITSMSGGAYSGTYTVGFETGEAVSGEFQTTSCPGLATYLSTPTHSCGG
jgi:hypothetical protein